MIKHFFSFSNIFFYTQQAFVLHILRDFCNVHDHIIAFFRFLLKNISIAQKSVEYLKDNISKCFLTSIRDFYIVQKIDFLYNI